MMADTQQGGSVNASEIQNIEATLLLEAMYQRYGYDFRNYARASVERRLRLFLTAAGESKLSNLIPRALHDEAFFSDMIQALSVPTTEMFRDPHVYRTIREQVVPLLRTWPRFKIWHAGCSTGEEAYSLAIVLMEEGLAERATIYATDFNDSSLTKARNGIYRLDRVQAYTKAYQESGGKESFSDYYHARYDSAVMNASVRDMVTFSNHNLAIDGVFGEMHLILCRNVLIYFNKELQNRVLDLFAESLVNGGLLCLGAKEDLRFSSVVSRFKEEHSKAKIFKKIGVS